tara:strand:- start:1402 stop:1734 length:333 start_codon:yes stop_codon:yes gene_type:complete
MKYIYYLIGFIIIYNIIKYLLFKEKKKKMIGLYGENIGTAIANKKVLFGMTTEMLKKSWGKPDNIDGKVIRKDSVKYYYHYGAYKNKRGNTAYKYRITMINNVIDEIKEN